MSGASGGADEDDDTMGLILDPNTPLSLSISSNNKNNDNNGDNNKMVYDESTQRWVSTEEGGDVDLSGFESEKDEDGKIGEKVVEKVDKKVEEVEDVEEIEELEEENNDNDNEDEEDVTGSLNTSEYELVEKVIIKKPVATVDVTASSTISLPSVDNKELVEEEDGDGIDVSGSLHTEEYALVVGVKKPSLVTSTVPIAQLSSLSTDATKSVHQETSMEEFGIEIEEEEMLEELVHETQGVGEVSLRSEEYIHSEVVLKPPSLTTTSQDSPIHTPLEVSVVDIPSVSLHTTPLEISLLDEADHSMTLDDPIASGQGLALLAQGQGQSPADKSLPVSVDSHPGEGQGEEGDEQTVHWGSPASRKLLRLSSHNEDEILVQIAPAPVVTTADVLVPVDPSTPAEAPVSSFIPMSSSPTIVMLPISLPSSPSRSSPASLHHPDHISPSETPVNSSPSTHSEVPSRVGSGVGGGNTVAAVMKRMRTIEGPLFDMGDSAQGHGLGLTPVPERIQSSEADLVISEEVGKDGHLVEAVTDALLRSLLTEISLLSTDQGMIGQADGRTMFVPTGPGGRTEAGGGVDMLQKDTTRIMEGVLKRERTMGGVLLGKGVGGARGVGGESKMGSDKSPSSPVVTRTARVISPPLPSPLPSPIPSPPTSPVAIIHKRSEGTEPYPNISYPYPTLLNPLITPLLTIPHPYPSLPNLPRPRDAFVTIRFCQSIHPLVVSRFTFSKKNRRRQ